MDPFGWAVEEPTVFGRVREEAAEVLDDEKVGNDVDLEGFGKSVPVQVSGAFLWYKQGSTCEKGGVDIRVIELLLL